MKSRVLILGGVEFIGSRFAAQLSGSDSFQPVLAGRSADMPDMAASYEFVNCDVTDANALHKLLTDFSMIVNCVAGDADTMVRSSDALFSVASARGSPPILQLSTMAAYGSAIGTVDERAPLLGDVDAYAAARAKIDQMAQKYGCICLRPGIIYGPGSKRWSGQIGSLLAAKRLGDLGIAGDGICNLIFIDDLLAAMTRVLDHPGSVTGAVNLCTSERMTWNDYFVQYAKALGAVPVTRITGRRLRIEAKIVAPPLKAAEILLGSRMSRRFRLPELISPSLLRVCSQDITLDTRKASSSLAISWTPVATGLALAAQWYRSSYCQR